MKDKNGNIIVEGTVSYSESFKLDVHSLIKQAIKQEEEKKIPELLTMCDYMLVYTTKYTDLKKAIDFDFEKGKYIGAVGEDKVKFMLQDHTGQLCEELVINAKDYGKTWIAIQSTTIFGSMLEHEHKKMIEIALGNVPQEWKDKVKIK